MSEIKTPADILFEICMGAPLPAPDQDIHGMRARWEKRATEYDKARLALPKDVGAFVVEVEERWRGIPDVTRLCAIIREQGAELALRRADRFIGRHEEETGVYHGDYNQHREMGWACNGCGGFAGHEHSPCENCDNALTRAQKENAALRARLAKLETAVRKVYTTHNEFRVSTEHSDAIAKLGELVKETDGGR